MKRVISTTMVMVLALFAGMNITHAAEEGNSKEADLKIISSDQMTDLTKDFVSAYRAYNKEVSISFGTLEGQSIDEALAFPGQMAIITKSQLSEINLNELRASVIGREIFVPVMHPDNPFREEISERGISPEEFALAYSAESGRWSDLLENGQNATLHAYRIDDSSFESYLGAFIGKKGQNISGKVLASCEEVMKAVSKDIYGIGFCNLSQLQQMEYLNKSDVTVIPVDIDGNDRIDHFEQYFGSVDELARGVWIGKYPGALYSRIYAVYNPRLSSSAEEAFIKWMVTGGQELFADHGYSGLLENEQENVLAGLEQPAMQSSESASRNTKSSSLLLIVVSIIAGIALVYLVLRAFDTGKDESDKGLIRGESRPYNTDPDSLPGGYYFDQSHTWAFMEKNGRLSIGIDNFLTYITGRITKVQMKKPGEKVKKGESVLSLMQHGKTMEIKSPVSGTIRNVNEELFGNAELLNVSPYDEGWLYEVEPSNWQTEMKAFVMRDKYANWIRDEFDRLKDFMMESLKPLAGKQVVLQDGGEVKQGLLEDLGPEAWEEFQTGFLKV